MEDNTCEFKLGDVVWLKSDSPAMTVEDVAEGRCALVWSDVNGKLHRATIPEYCLTDSPPVDPDELEDDENFIYDPDGDEDDEDD